MILQSMILYFILISHF